MNILIVEDSRISRKLLTDLCQMLGHQVRVAKDGWEAVAMYRKEPVVLMDLQMPGMDGFDAAGRILEVCPTAYIIAVTSHTSPEHQACCMEIGFAEFIPKPIELVQLHAALERARKRAEEASVLPANPEE